MRFNKLLQLLSESPYTKAMVYYRVWCDDHDEYVKSKEALFKYGIENKIPKNILHEISDDLRIEIKDWSSYKW